MRHLFILSAASLVFFSACKKSSSNPTYYMNATVGGVAKTFDQQPVVTNQVGLGFTTVTITADADPTTGESMVLSLDNIPSGAPVVAGTYSDSSTLFNVTAVYSQNASSEYLAGTNVFQAAKGTSLVINNHFKLVLNTFTNTTISGTFSGDFFSSANSSAAPITITGGVFNEQFQ